VDHQGADLLKPKPPQPAKGDRVKLRGREPVGILSHREPNGWANVKWDEGCCGPKIVHINELEILPP
jgi:hypothetical protein